MQTLTRLRDIQIVSAAKIFRYVGNKTVGRRLIERVGSSRFGAALLGLTLGYRRSFRTLDEAEKAVKPFAKGGHENPVNVSWHLDLAVLTSDYAAFYYLRDRLANVRKIFDLGGNVGNLYYRYKDYLPLREDAIWTVYDLPENIARGRTLASSRNAKSLAFTDDLRDVDGVDLFIASGALHYFGKSLPELFEGVTRRPKYILINRTPMTELPDFAIIQDVRHIRVACKLYNRSKLIADFERLGYRVVGEWRAHEYGIPVLDRPSSSVKSYTGLWLELQ